MTMRTSRLSSWLWATGIWPRIGGSTRRPVGAVLDHFRLDRVILLGISLGGCLAIRAAAFEPRVERVIADDVLTDFLACNLWQVPPAARTAVRMLRSLRAKRLLDAVAHRRMRRDLASAWGVARGQHVLGVRSPHDYFTAVKRFTTAELSPNVHADVLLMAGAEDHYVPLGQLPDQIRSLTGARSVTARVFTRHEQAQNHCQVGNIALSVRVMLDWLRGLDARDGHLDEEMYFWLGRGLRDEEDGSSKASGSGRFSLIG